MTKFSTFFLSLEGVDFMSDKYFLVFTQLAPFVKKLNVKAYLVIVLNRMKCYQQILSHFLHLSGSVDDVAKVFILKFLNKRLEVIQLNGAFPQASTYAFLKLKQ